MSPGVYYAFACAVLALHLIWIAWVIFGVLVTRGRPWLAGFHAASLVYGIFISLGNWPCPLTLAEQRLQTAAGRTAYTSDFLAHYLEALIYPDIPPLLLAVSASAVCLFNLGLYARRLARRAV